MNNEFISFIIVFVLILCFFLHYESKYSDLTYVTSTIDKKKYLVRNRKDKQKAANLLATVKKNLKAIVDYTRKDFSSDPKVQRLITNYKPNKISESIPNTNYTSYSVNKGEKIVFCIRSKDKKRKLVNVNTIMFVAIHELAHVMTKSIGHTPEFWSNMKYLLQRGIEIGVYKKVDYRKNPKPYCGTKITDSPLQ
jgi:predicted metal-dependent hydrolase